MTPRSFAIFVALVVALSVQARAARANSCKADGEACRTNQSCCSGACVNGAPPGSKPFGLCCRPTTCAAQGATCGTIPSGDCPQPLDCGSCTSPDTCGGGGTPNVCGCTPTTCAAQGANCGTISDGCSGALDCGTCTAPATCGGDGTPNVCGGEVPCTTSADCISTRVCFLGFCEPKLVNRRACEQVLDCVSGCCCAKPGCTIDTDSLVFSAPGVCTDPADCPMNAADQCPLAFAPAKDFTTCNQ